MRTGCRGQSLSRQSCRNGAVCLGNELQRGDSAVANKRLGTLAGVCWTCGGVVSKQNLEPPRIGQPLAMKHALPDSELGGPSSDLGPSLEDRETGASARPCFTIDAALGLIVDANPAAWTVLGFEAVAVTLPVAVDSGMPALQHLKQFARARQISATENLTFWTPRGVKQLHCHVRRPKAGESLFVIRVLEDA